MVQPAFDAAFAGQYDGLRAALVDARDYVGFALADTWKRLKADDFSYLDVAETLIEVDRMMSGGPLSGGRWSRASTGARSDARPSARASSRRAPRQPHPLATHDHAGIGKGCRRWLTANGRSRRGLLFNSLRGDL